ncbi:MAG TPA: S9 family peptidase [Gemmatimonadaceae bacterium]|nr:S9 family peptidase [Gemmatimonadaceae bacterium]
MRRLIAFLWLVPTVALAQARHVPSVDELLSLRSASGAQISPDGSLVAYLVTETDWKNDNFVSQLWVVKSDGSDAHQLTRGEKPAAQPRWSPDGKWIAFTSTRVDSKSQIFAIRPDGGEAIQLTKNESGVQGFSWSRDGRTVAFTAVESSPTAKERKNSFAEFEVVRRDYTHVHLWTIDVAAAMTTPAEGTQRTRGSTYSVNDFAWSPDGTRLAFSATVNPDLVQNGTSDVYVLSLSDDAVKKIVELKGPDGGPVWSPDGKQIAFATSLERWPFFATNSRIAVVSAEGGPVRSLTDGFDEDLRPSAWTSAGVYFSALARTASHIYLLDPQTSGVTRVSGPDRAMVNGLSLSADGRNVAFMLASPTSLAEVAVSPVASWSPRVLTRMTSQIDSLITATREVISWKSKDGAMIEGILIKPASFDSSRKYPLLVKIHGGPTGIDRPVLLSATRYYPIETWVGRGALALEVNYRGSAGYGEKFRTLNVRNLGVGDAWDVLSGVDYLIRKGWVDSTKVASMGWSQGGYISAFLTASSSRFAAISVGAGISDWATYYYNTDITPFTIHYLGADPVADPAVYAKTSPIAYVKQARTPTLIQHGDGDRRVPIANAYELRQALEDRHVPVEMVVYKGFGHGITRPKSQRAVMTHNLVWFNHYLWGDPLPDLRLPSSSATAVQAGKGEK